MPYQARTTCWQELKNLDQAILIGRSSELFSESISPLLGSSTEDTQVLRLSVSLECCQFLNGFPILHEPAQPFHLQGFQLCCHDPEAIDWIQTHFQIACIRGNCHIKWSRLQRLFMQTLRCLFTGSMHMLASSQATPWTPTLSCWICVIAWLQSIHINKCERKVIIWKFKSADTYKSIRSRKVDISHAKQDIYLAWSRCLGSSCAQCTECIGDANGHV